MFNNLREKSMRKLQNLQRTYLIYGTTAKHVNKDLPTNKTIVNDF